MTKGEDRRTTPRWLQLPGLLLLIALAGYYWTAYRSVYSKTPPRIAVRNPYTFWFGTWKMFTMKERYHVTMEAEALVEGQWESFDLDALYPYRWESGYRYSRSVFRRHGPRMRTLANATCGRYADAHGTPPAMLRFHKIKWRKTLGSTKQPRGKKRRESSTLLLEWDCNRGLDLPQGRVL